MPAVDLFLCGDVMTGRGIDQILPHPSSPELYEPYLRDAREYVRLAEEASGPVPRPVDPAYVWGEALAVLEERAPHARIVNLETSVTRSAEPWPDKDIHYRMHPDNVACLTAARVDVCVLANNHVIDWGRAGLVETLDTLRGAGITTVGAGRDASEAEAVAVAAGREGRVLVAAAGHGSSGVFREWRAGDGVPGIAVVDALGAAEAGALAARLARARRPGDVAVVSIHWGSNWGYEVPDEQVRFARALVDAGVDVVHGHSSHHPRPIEIYRERPIFYGCGDLLTDYEGIGGHERFRGDLSLMYFPRLEGGRLVELRMQPMRVRKLRLERASAAEAAWLAETLSRVSRPFGTEVASAEQGSLVARATRS